MTLREKYIKEWSDRHEDAGDRRKCADLPGTGRHAVQLLSQLKQAGKEDQLQAGYWKKYRGSAKTLVCLRWLPRLLRSSATQAVFNVILGERYKMCTAEFKDMVRGAYGRTPVSGRPRIPEEESAAMPRSSPVVLQIRWRLSWILCARNAQSGGSRSEDVLTYAMFPKVAPKFFEARRNAKYGFDGARADQANGRSSGIISRKGEGEYPFQQMAAAEVIRRLLFCVWAKFAIFGLKNFTFYNRAAKIPAGFEKGKR